MEFGLQKAEKVGESPVIVGNPRKRIEAKAYRARDRMDGGWFRHDAGAEENLVVPSKELAAVSPLRSVLGYNQHISAKSPQPCVQHCLCAKSLYRVPEHIVPAGITSSPRKMTSGQSPSKFQSLFPDPASRLQQQIYPNCNDWYRHEHTMICDNADEDAMMEQEPCQSPVPTSQHLGQTGGGQCSPHSRRVCAKAEEYWKRNHNGSTKDWYRHEHTFVEEKENKLADVDTVPTSEFGLREPNPVTAADEHACCLCGGSGLSPAKNSYKLAGRPVLTERF